MDELRILPRAGLDDLLAGLRRLGFTPLGPRVRDGAIVVEEVEFADDLPVGWTADQDAGTYRLRRREDGACFGYAVGPCSAKRRLLPPRVRLWTASRGNGGFEVDEEPAPEERVALVGLRACDLHAIAIQDRVFLRGAHRERDYAERRARIFVVAVDCGEPAATCFCVSTGSGPAVEAGFDLALTELLEGEHRFLVRAGSARGAALLDELPARPATEDDVAAAEAVRARAAASMGRELETDGLHDVLLGALEHPRWDDVAERCLTCGNCTLVCPTCFCTSVEDVNDLAGDHAERWRTWDTCFSVDYAYVHGGSTRPSARSRYRQWLTHKLATWEDQFGTSGCVGCGRCIAWCPAAIDITEEARALRAGEESHAHD